MEQIILASFIIMLASLAGVVSVWRRFGRLIENNLGYLVSLAAGVFIVVAYQLSAEALEHASSLASGFLWIGLGILTWGLVFKFIPSFHRHHDTIGDCEKDHQIDIRRLLAGDAIHNLGDGILLTSAFLISPALGLATAISIFVHEIVQETSEFFVLRKAGLSVRLALIINFLISGTILVGALASWFLFETFSVLETPLLGLAGGAFLVVALMDLIPHSIKSSQDKKDSLKHIIWFSIGFFLILTVNLFTVHSHDLGDDHGHSHEQSSEEHLDDDHLKEEEHPHHEHSSEENHHEEEPGH